MIWSNLDVETSSGIVAACLPILGILCSNTREKSSSRTPRTDAVGSNWSRSNGSANERRRKTESVSLVEGRGLHSMNTKCGRISALSGDRNKRPLWTHSLGGTSRVSNDIERWRRTRLLILQRFTPSMICIGFMGKAKC